MKQIGFQIFLVFLGLAAMLMALTFNGCGEAGLPPANPNPEPTPEATVEPAPTPYQNPTCLETMGLDGRRFPEGGFLMKNGDHTDKAVILFPSEYQAEFDAVRVLTRNGNFEEFVYTGKSNETRQTWRGRRKVRYYINNGDIRINAFDPEGPICIWNIEDASKVRND